MKRLLILLALGLGLFAAPAAHAQSTGCGVNYTPQIGINCANVRQSTYIAGTNGLVPAASATDFMCLAGSSSKTIHIRRIFLSGTAGTLITTPISIRRITVTLNTGTVSTAIFSPRALNPNNSTNTAVFTAYDATGGNPTVTGTTAGFTARELTLGVSATAEPPTDRVEWDFGTGIDAYAQGLDIPSGSTTTQYCLNLGGVSVSSGKIYATIIWSEE